MAEKRNLLKMMKKLEQFEAWERRDAGRILSYAEDSEFSGSQRDLLGQLADKGISLAYGKLTFLYGAYRELENDISREDQRGERFDKIRYTRYEQALKEMPELEQPHFGLDKRLEQEAFLALSLLPEERGSTFSDFFNSEMLREDWGDNIRYCAPWKKWIIWDGKRWEIDESGKVFDMGEKTIRRLFKKMPGYCHSSEEALAMMAHARRSSSAHKVESMLTTARWHESIRVMPDEMDQDQFLFNCGNGVIDLTCGRLFLHQRERLISKFSPVEYDINADCPLWKKFLKDIFGGNRELIKFVQRFLSCCLTGDMSCQAMFILYGSGANGKSTFINVINKVMGDYSTTTPTETFMQKKGDQASNDIARLKGARFVTAMESDERGKLAESIIKRLTGNDVISARFLYGEFFQFVPTFKIVMATNHKPRVSGLDYAIWRRIKLIPFEQTFPDEKQDRKLPDKLEKELPGILKWMVEGCIRWQKEGLGDVEAVSKATDEYKNQMSDIQMFLSDCCTMEEEEMVRACDLYDAYKIWCEENHERVKSNRNFGMLLAESGLDKVRLSRGNHWIGLKIST